MKAIIKEIQVSHLPHDYQTNKNYLAICCERMDFEPSHDEIKGKFFSDGLVIGLDTLNRLLSEHDDFGSALTELALHEDIVEYTTVVELGDEYLFPSDSCTWQEIKDVYVTSWKSRDRDKKGGHTMRNLIELIEEYPQHFGKCTDERDVIDTLDRAHTSREILYMRRDRMGTYDITDNVAIKDCDTHDTCLGYYTVEFGTKNIINIKVFIEIDLWDFDKEENRYSVESYREIGWE